MLSIRKNLIEKLNVNHNKLETLLFLKDFKSLKYINITENLFSNNERFLSPDIDLVLLSGDLYIRAFQYITNQKDQLINYDDIINYFYD